MVRTLTGTVISAGKMMKTVTVRLAMERWNTRVRKNFIHRFKVLVSDPNSSLLEGDVVSLTPWRTAQHVRYTVKQILAPFGKPVDERPPVLSAEEREAIHLERRTRKIERRIERVATEIRGGEAQEQLAARGNKKADKVRKALPGGSHNFEEIIEDVGNVNMRAKNELNYGRENEKDIEMTADLNMEEVARSTLTR